MKVSPVAKAVVSAVGAVATVLSGTVADGVFDASDTAQVVTQVVTLLVSVYAVWRVPNKPAGGVSTPPAVPVPLRGYERP